VSNPFISPATAQDATPATTKPASIRIAAAILWAIVVAVVGGLACGWLIMRFGEWGSVGLWACGVIGGYVARKITGCRSRAVAIALVAACVVALLLAETWWIRRNWNPPPQDWAGAIRLLPEFAERFHISVFIAVLFCAFGAHSGWLQMGRRYRRVAVED